MIPLNTLWFGILILVVLYLAAHWVRSRTATEEQQSESVRYLIRSSEAGAAGQLGAQGGLDVARYYFRETDQATGPADPSDFFDELFVELRGEDSGQTWQNSIHVATPRALDRVMQEEHWDSIIGTELLIVRRYDLNVILQGAIDHLQEIYEAKIRIAGKDLSSRPPLA